MAWGDRLMTAIWAGASAFRAAYTHTGGGISYAREYDLETHSGRSARYALYRAFRGNNAYDRLNRFAQTYKKENGLYRFTRGCYNPAARIVEFHVNHTMGGHLDPNAGDGSLTPTACPIMGVADSDRPAIAKLFADSRWASKKDLWVRDGATCGDAVLILRDDVDRGRVMVEPIDPETIYDVQRDSDGSTLGYTRCELRPDPRPNPRDLLVEFREDCEIDRRTGDVSWFTYLDGKEYPWNGVTAAWRVPLGFVPLWLVQHIDTGLLWGESELEVGRAKMDEVNDLGSKLHDQIRQMVEGAHAITGAKPPRTTPRFDANADETDEDSPQDGRQNGKILWIPAQEARVASLIHDLDIRGVSEEIRQALDCLEDDYPELRFERLRTGGTISGEALRIAQQPAGKRVQGRRPAYDAALGRAIRGALALGGWHRYPGYESFDVEDYRGPRLDKLAVGYRDVFEVDEQDRLAKEQKRNEVVLMGVNAGIPVGTAMRRAGGFTEAEIAEASKQATDKMEADMKPAATVTTMQPEKNTSY